MNYRDQNASEREADLLERIERDIERLEHAEDRADEDDGFEPGGAVYMAYWFNRVQA